MIARGKLRNHTKTWHYSICECCYAHTGKEVKMKKMEIEVNGKKVEIWCCPRCGRIKKR